MDILITLKGMLSKFRRAGEPIAGRFLVMKKGKTHNSNGLWLTVPVLALCAILLPFALGLWPVVRFPRERIEVYLQPARFEVVGYYYYRNPWPFPVVQAMYYPLPMSDDEAEKTEVEAIRIEPGPDALPVTYHLGNHRYTVTFPARGEVCVRVRYRQNAPDGRGRYILVTTKDWKRPLEEGVYRLHAQGVKVVGSNYALAEIQPGELGFDRTDFMPEKDWIFSWKDDGS